MPLPNTQLTIVLYKKLDAKCDQQVMIDGQQLIALVMLTRPYNCQVLSVTD